MRDTVGFNDTLQHKGAAAAASVRTLTDKHFHQAKILYILVLFIRFHDRDSHQFHLTIDQPTISKL